VPDPADDPDALWRPGYEGGYRHPEPGATAITARPRRRGRLAGALLTVAVISTVLALVLPGRDTGNHDATTVPTTAWSVTYGTTAVAAVTTTPDRVAVLIDRPAVAVVLDLADGAEQWRARVPGDSITGLDVVDDVVVARHVNADGSGGVDAFDLSNGVRLWRAPLATGERIDVIDGELRRIRVRDLPAGPAGEEQIDPRTAEPLRVVGPGERGEPTDNVIRALSATATVDARLAIEVTGGMVEVLLDRAVDATTISFEPAAVQPAR
jgi:hypothetical protein